MASGVLIVLHWIVVVVSVRFYGTRSGRSKGHAFVTVKSIRQLWFVLLSLLSLIHISASPTTGLRKLEAKTKGLTTGFL